MKDRENDFKDYSWELCRRENCPSNEALAEKAMRIGYEMAVKDSTELCGTALESLKKLRERSNAPQ